MKPHRTLLPALAGLLLFLACDYGDQELQSIWRAGIADTAGTDSTWTKSSTYPMQRFEDKKFSFGFCNNGQYLFVFLTTGDQGIMRQILGRGFTVWLDPDPIPYKRRKAFGIHYPVGLARNGFKRPEKQPDAKPDGAPQLPAELFREMEIFGPETNMVYRTVPEGPHGISVKLTTERTELSYAFKIPLQKTPATPYALGADAGKTITIGLETPPGAVHSREESDRGGPSGMSGGMGGGGMGGGMGGMGGGGMGGMGGRGGGMGGMGGGGHGGGMGRGGGHHGGGGIEPSEPVNFWLKVKLAAKPAVAGDSLSPAQK